MNTPPVPLPMKGKTMYQDTEALAAKRHRRAIAQNLIIGGMLLAGIVAGWVIGNGIADLTLHR